MKQVKAISDLGLRKGAISKADIGDIEPEATISNFSGETFFSLFIEHDAIYEKIYSQLASMGTDEDRSILRTSFTGGVSQYVRILSYVLQ